MELQSIGINTGNFKDRFVDDTGAEGLRGKIVVWLDDDRDDPERIGDVFMRGDGYTRIKASGGYDHAPAIYVAEMVHYTPKGRSVSFMAIRILAVPVCRKGKWSYTDRILIHPAKYPSQLQGCIAPDGWPIGKLFDALGGFKVGKQFRLTVY